MVLIGRFIASVFYKTKMDHKNTLIIITFLAWEGGVVSTVWSTKKQFVSHNIDRIPADRFEILFIICSLEIISSWAGLYFGHFCHFKFQTISDNFPLGIHVGYVKWLSCLVEIPFVFFADWIKFSSLGWFRNREQPVYKLL